MRPLIFVICMMPVLINGLHQHAEKQSEETVLGQSLKLQPLKSSSSNTQPTEKTAEQIKEEKDLVSDLQNLYEYLHEPHIFRLLKLNLETIQSNNSKLLEDQYSYKEIQSIIKIREFFKAFQECPFDKPFFNGEKCVQCVNPTELYNVQAGKCTGCRIGTSFNSQKKQCMTVIGSTNVSLNQQQLEKAEELIIIRANKFAAGMMSFIHEEISNIKNLIDNSSQTKVEVRDPNVKANRTNPHYLNLVIFINGQKEEDYQLSEYDIPCPKELPFYSRDHCIKCPEPNHLFDATTNLCVQCSTGHIYSLIRHQCVFNQNS